MRALRWSGIDSNVQFRATGAWAEEVDTKPAFLVPLDNSYDWKKTATGKQPYVIALADRQLMDMAGLWETWRSPAGERIRSFTIITTTPNELCAELHNRTPVVLKPDGHPSVQQALRNHYFDSLGLPRLHVPDYA